MDLANEAEQGEALKPQATVAILDFGAQLPDVIKWQVIDIGIRADIIPVTRGSDPIDPDYIKANYGAVIFTGSGESVNEPGAPDIPPGLIDGSLPALGICYGGQAIAKALGGRVGKAEADGHAMGEFGQTKIEVLVPDSAFYQGVPSDTVVQMSHGDSILELPESFRQTARSGDIVASFESADGRIIGTQFHPEVSETVYGREMFRHFLVDVAGIKPDPEHTLDSVLEEYLQKEQAKISEILRRGYMISGFLSGGIDSAVAAEIIMEVARGEGHEEQVKFFYVNNGLMRYEDESVIRTMTDRGIPVELIDASETFFFKRVMLKDDSGHVYLGPALVDTEDPKIKRQIIGEIFRLISLSIKDDIQNAAHSPVFFMQGTNESDLIESGGSGGKQIKGHHNIEAMEDQRKAGELVEPLIKS